MIQRVRQLITTKNMTSSGFADRVGVPRSTISHILSGRNKPSLELVQKILDAFPDIRTEWLVRGKGNMSDEARDLFSFTETTASSKEAPSSADPDTIKSSEQAPADHDTGPGDDANGTRGDGLQGTAGGQGKEGYERGKEVSPRKETPGDTGQEQKVMIRLISIYSDGTFSVFTPSRLKPFQL